MPERERVLEQIVERVRVLEQIVERELVEERQEQERARLVVVVLAEPWVLSPFAPVAEGAAALACYP